MSFPFLDFLKGFCPAGNDCKLKHFVEKSPEKKKTATEAAAAAAPEVVMREKKVPPAKPKRKSLCQTPMAIEKKARVRYYDGERSASSQQESGSGKIRLERDDSEADKSELVARQQLTSPGYEQRRQRLLRKVELAKQVSCPAGLSLSI